MHNRFEKQGESPRTPKEYRPLEVASVPPQFRELQLECTPALRNMLLRHGVSVDEDISAVSAMVPVRKAGLYKHVSQEEQEGKHSSGDSYIWYALQRTPSVNAACEAAGVVFDDTGDDYHHTIAVLIPVQKPASATHAEASGAIRAAATGVQGKIVQATLAPDADATIAVETADRQGTVELPYAPMLQLIGTLQHYAAILPPDRRAELLSIADNFREAKDNPEIRTFPYKDLFITLYAINNDIEEGTIRKDAPGRMDLCRHVTTGIDNITEALGRLGLSPFSPDSLQQYPSGWLQLNNPEEVSTGRVTRVLQPGLRLDSDNTLSVRAIVEAR